MQAPVFTIGQPRKGGGIIHFISVKAAANLLGISKTLLHRRIQRGSIAPDVVIVGESGQKTYGFNRDRVVAQKNWRESIT